MMKILLKVLDAIHELLTHPKQDLREEQEPVAWMYDWNRLAEDEYGETRYDCLTRAEAITNKRAITNIRPLYKSPSKREPLSDERLRDLSNSINDYPDFGNVSVWQAFYIARLIEKAHGITGGEE